MAWKFFLTITNNTDRNLEVVSSSAEWGHWYRNGIDNTEPCSINPGATLQAVGVRASTGTWTGYECHVQWKDVAPSGQPNYGNISLTVDVPFVGMNQSDLAIAGMLWGSGWTPIGTSGSDFVRSVAVNVGPSGDLVVSEVPGSTDPALFGPPADSLDEILTAEYQEFIAAVLAKNPDVRDWNSIRDRLPEVEKFNPVEHLPQKPTLSERLLARTDPTLVEPSLWSGINDPQCPTLAAKKLFVDEYFWVKIYSVGTNPRDIISLPAGSSKEVSDRIMITSAVRHILTQNLSIRSSLTGGASDPESGANIAASMDMEGGFTNVLEESTETVSETIRSERFVAPEDQDLHIVPWVISEAAVLYRLDKKGNVRLLAISDWATTQLFKSYRVPVSI